MGEQEKKKRRIKKMTHYCSTMGGGEVCVCGEDEDENKKKVGEGERGQWPGSCELHTGILQLRGARVWHRLDELSQAPNMNTAVLSIC